jgi:hypothetical protein
MAQSEDGRKIFSSITEEGFIVLGSTLLENGHIILWDLLGSVSVTSNVTGVLNTSRKITGSTSATSALTGTLSRARPFAGSIVSSASMSGSLYVPLKGVINAVSSPRVHIMRRRTSVNSRQVQLFDVIPAFLSLTWSLNGLISATVALSGTLGVAWSLKGGAPATTSLSATSSVVWSLKGGIAAISSVSGSLIEKTYLAGTIGAVSDPRLHIIRRRACLLSPRVRFFYIKSAVLSRQRSLKGAISATTLLQGNLVHRAPERGFYYAKLGTYNGRD